jgi:hypothetical protein
VTGAVPALFGNKIGLGVALPKGSGPHGQNQCHTAGEPQYVDDEILVSAILRSYNTLPDTIFPAQRL